MARIALSALWLFAILTATCAGALAEKRVALVVGNAAYQHATPLANPKNDADAVAAALERLGFEVVAGTDLDRLQFEAKIREFARTIRGADVALVFYAGHGLQVGGHNYLAPVNARLEDEADLEFETIRLETIMAQMERVPRTNLVFLDACRDNPMVRNLARSMGTRSASVGRGLARVDTGIGTLIAFATQPGNVALDGAGINSPFTEALLEHIETPKLDVAVMLRRVRQQVIRATDGKQVPWSNSSLTGSFLFKHEAATPPADVDPPVSGGDDPGPNRTSIELSYWETIRDSTRAEDFRSYLRRFPDGIFTDLAAIRLEELEPDPVPPQPEVVPRGTLVNAADVVESVRDAVVSIRAETEAPGEPVPPPQLPEGSPFQDFFESFFDENTSGQSQPTLGAGVLVSADGHVVTTRDIVANARTIEVITGDGRRLAAELVGADADTNIAVLKVASGGGAFSFVDFARRGVAPGEHVLAIGNPFGLGGSVASGTVVGWDPVDTPLDHIEVDAPINKGNSGGPLIDSAGNIAGISSTMRIDPGKGFHRGYFIPANVAAEAMAQLRRSGEITDRASLDAEMGRVQSLSADPGAIMFVDASGLEDVAATTRSAVVALRVDGEEQKDGVGFFISGDGHIVTNHHTIDGARAITVIDVDGRESAADVVGSDDRTDLAVLRVRGSQTRSFVRFAARSPRVGETVAGYAGSDQTGKALRGGIISALERDINAGPYDRFQQTDIAIASTDTGGPLLNLDGDVVGVLTAVMSPADESVGLTFAVPVEVVRDVVARIRDTGEVERGWIGVRIQQVTDELAEGLGLPGAGGALVAAVTKGGPSERAGIEPGDVILRFNGSEIANMRDLPGRVAAVAPGNVVAVEIVRNGQTISRDLTLGRLSDAPAEPPEETRPGPADSGLSLNQSDGEIGEFGSLLLMPTSATTRSAFDIKSDTSGLVVTGVHPNSGIDEKGLEPGDVLIEVSQDTVSDLAAMWLAVDTADREGRSAILLLVQGVGSGNLRFVAVPVSDLRGGKKGQLARAGKAFDSGSGVPQDAELAAAHLLAAFDKFDTILRAESRDWTNTLSKPTREAIQRRLAETGHYTGRIDGVIGPGTQRALQAYATRP